MKYVSFFPHSQNVHLVKDVGMIPYIMDKYFNYQGYVACYGDDNYTYLEDELQELEIDVIQKRTGNIIVDGIYYLIKNAKNIGALQLMHSTKENLILGYVYKMLNKKGQLYLKLDSSSNIDKEKYYSSKYKIIKPIKKHFLKKFDLISTESKKTMDFLNEVWQLDIKYIPNGFYDNGKKDQIKKKENVICTVGRIGTYQKANEILLEGFKEAHKDLKDWKLKVIGPIEEDFKKYIDDYMQKNKDVAKDIIFTGNISDRAVLDEEYRKSKIFCLTSRFEGFPLVFPEAIKNGCFIISTDIVPAWDITDDKKYGDIFEVDNAKELSTVLKKWCSEENDLDKMASEIQNFAYENFYWVEICNRLNNYLIQKR